MASDESSDQGGSKRVSRRRYIQTAVASGVGVSLAGCSGGGGGGGDGGDGGGNSPNGDGGGGSGGTTIQFAADDNFKGKQETFNQLLHENGVDSGISVEFLGGSFVSSGRQNKYKNILNAKQKKPTLFMMDNGWTIPFIARGQIANLSEELPSSTVSTVQDTYLDNMLATATADGDLYGVPLFADFPTMLYRKDKVKEVGYSDSDINKWATESMQWKQFSNLVRETLDNNPDMNGYNFQGAAYIGLSCCDFVEFMSSWGGSYFGKFENLFGPVGGRPVTVDEQPVVKAINMVRHFIYGENPNGNWGEYAGNISPQAVVQYKEESSRKPYTNGNTLFHRNWPYAINLSAADDALGQDKVGVMPLPYGVTADESKYGPQIGGIPSALGGWHVTLNPNAPQAKKDAATQVFEALTKKPMQIGLLGAGGWLPPVSEVLNSKEAKEETGTISPYMDSLAVAAQNAVPRPVTVVWPQQADKVEVEVNAAFKQEKSAKKAMGSLKKSLKSLEEQFAE